MKTEKHIKYPFSIRRMMTIIFTIMILVPVFALSGFSYRSYQNRLAKASEAHSMETLRTIDSNITAYLDEYSRLARSALLSETIHSAMTISVRSGLSSVERCALFQRYRNEVIGYREHLKEIYAVSLDGLILPAIGFSSMLPKPIEQYDWFQTVLAADGGVVVDAGQSWLNDVYPSFQTSITVSRLMKRVTAGASSKGYDTLGVLVFELSPSFLSALLRDTLNKTSHLILTDRNGTILYDSASSDTGAYVTDCYRVCVLTDQGPSFASNAKADSFYQAKRLHYDWNAYLITETSDTVAEAMQYIQPLCTVGVSLIVMLFLLSLYFSKSVMKPLDTIQNSMANLRQGKFTGRVAGAFPEELQGLVDSYNEMSDDLEELLTENYLARIENLESQYGALQSQMNPHFIYNILEVINFQLTLSGNPDLAQTTRDLAKLIRYNMRSENGMTTMGADMQNLDSYCRLMQEVYRGFAGFELLLPAELENYAIPCFTLQPIVENSILHGFADIDHPGHIRVEVSLAHSDLVIEVTDDGSGMEEERLTTIRQSLTEPAAPINNGKRSSVGLSNIHRRLSFRFGKKYGLSIESKKNSYTKVTVRIPQMTGSTLAR